jgi:hypothetical protein
MGSKGISEAVAGNLFWIIFAVVAVLVLLGLLQLYGTRLFPIRVS